MARPRRRAMARIVTIVRGLAPIHQPHLCYSTRWDHSLAVGDLAAPVEGEDHAGHQSAICHPLTQPEARFLQKAAPAMIIRAATVAADPSKPMDNIDVALGLSSGRSHGWVGTED